MPKMPSLLASSLVAAALCSTASAKPAVSNVERHVMPDGSRLILESATVKAGATQVFVSGTVADPIESGRPEASFGDTRTQAVSILKKIDAALHRRGMSIGDVVRLTVYVVADPALGKPDYAGMNAGFREFFGTEANPNTVTRSAFAISGLQVPGLYLEIDAVAAR